jgi:hypothetical protein
MKIAQGDPDQWGTSGGRAMELDTGCTMTIAPAIEFAWGKDHE